MTLKECMTLKEIFPTTIFSVKLMHDCIEVVRGLITYSLFEIKEHCQNVCINFYKL